MRGRREGSWITGAELGEGPERADQRDGRRKLGCWGLIGLWLSRMMMVWAVVAVPIAAAIGVARTVRGAIPWVLVPILCIAAAGGVLFSWRRWWTPPIWAVLLARAWGLEYRWRGEPGE